MKEFWATLSPASRKGFLVGISVICCATLVAIFWVFKPKYQVLFSDLKSQDSAAMVAELERMKVPYKIDETGNAILVDSDIVHVTRMKLMGRDIPVLGTVGLELFNNSDFGMTEFAQKINYQRALQGELTRTISALDEVSEVRVHLVLSEEGLFKRHNQSSKAAVTIGLKPGNHLRKEQVLGIQKLVAAAVPGVKVSDVTIVDKQGVALSKGQQGSEHDVEAVSQALDFKKEVETSINKKVFQILESRFGEGLVASTVDVTVNLDQQKVVTEQVLANNGENGAMSGIVSKEKEIIKEPGSTAGPDTSNSGSSSHRETEYLTGKRIEHLITQPGSIQKISAVVVIKKKLSEEELSKVRELVVASVGANLARGDNIVVTDSEGQVNTLPETVIQNPTNTQPLGKVGDENTNLNFRLSGQVQVVLGGVLVLILVGVFLLILIRRQGRSYSKPLSDFEREQALLKVRAWLSETDNTVAKSAGIKKDEFK